MQKNDSRTLTQQLREARAKATDGNWSYAEEGTMNRYRLQSDIGEYVFPEDLPNAKYITLLHNNLPKLLDRLEQAEREAEAGRELAEEMIKLSDEVERQYETEFNEWRAFKHFRNTMRDRLSDTYNKTVNKEV